jgi:hypothetical protein
MCQFETAPAYIHSLKGGKDTVEIIEEHGLDNVVARYKGKFYTAIFNPFSMAFYVDDKYGHLPDYIVSER